MTRGSRHVRYCIGSVAVDERGDLLPRGALRSCVLGLAGALGLLTLCAQTAAAQPAPANTAGKWEVEVLGGATLANHPTDGRSAGFEPGGVMTTLTGRPSRRVSSWYFGDGALLLNQLSAAFGTRARMTPLDEALTTAVVRRRPGGSFGLRVGRALNGRFTAEGSLQYHVATLQVTPSALAAIETSRTTFVAAWNDLFLNSPFLTPNVTSLSAVDQGRAWQILAAGTLNIALRRTAAVIPYVALGGGVVTNIGSAPGASLTGRYQPRFRGVTPIDETDSVTLRFAVDRHVLVGIIGGGLKYTVSPRWGVRWDARAYLSRNAVHTIVDAHPTVSPPPAGVSFALSFPFNPTVQFAGGNAFTGFQSSLSGPAIEDFRTFSGTGLQTQIAVTTGVFWRF